MNRLAKLQFRWYLFTQNIPQLATFLQSPSYKIRRLTASKMGQLKDVETIPFLKRILDDPALKVAETALYAIEVTAKSKQYSIDLQPYKQRLKERKSAIPDYRRMADFKFEKQSWIPIIKEKLKQPIFRFG